MHVKDEYDNEFEAVVCFGNSYHHAFGLYSEYGCWHDFNEMVSMTIIGNIHDNPELFKEKREQTDNDHNDMNEIIKESYVNPKVELTEKDYILED